MNENELKRCSESAISHAGRFCAFHRQPQATYQVSGDSLFEDAAGTHQPPSKRAYETSAVVSNTQMEQSQTVPSEVFVCAVLTVSRVTSLTSWLLNFMPCLTNSRACVYMLSYLFC
ncbi:hypothetical protein L596_010960 [Steinernema carpocapsae]|nr:hypothetical protein L596_010960 [Steinernema carpocapsae]